MRKRSIVQTDSIGAYNNHSLQEYTHYTVNSSDYPAKSWYKRVRGNHTYFQNPIDGAARGKLRLLEALAGDDTLFSAFLAGLRRVFVV